ncbi:MAG: winged helix-turn-helix domain-containing protein [Desulfobacterales bacterium]|nr:winged helix-turn-helix domain-containing protein [Desulfobacterales bacterium]MBL7173191.1 winged helix-turn-helix domain-containing protein [Desulfobacteraceae bacterium]
MSETGQEKQEKKEVMKTLRKAREHSIKRASAKLKEQNRIVKAIRERLRDQPATVPEIAAATGVPSSEIMWYVATMKKFGDILEADQDGSYFKYGLAVGGESGVAD